MPAFFRHARTALAAAALAVVAGGAHADNHAYPSKPIEWVVPYPAGGGTDIVARTLGEAIGAKLGQPVVIVNKPGAATAIGAEYLTRAKPDGYTIMSADTATLAANPFIYDKLSYDAEKSFAPVGLTVRFPLVLAVNPTVPVKNLDEFLAWAKKEGSPHFASPGSGSPHHLAGELFASKAQLKVSHVPYRGLAPAVQDVVGGQVPFMFVDTAGGQQQIAAGNLRPIGIANAKRVDSFKDIPTLDEQGLKGFEAQAWQGVVAPAGTPADVVEKLNKALAEALADPAIQKKLVDMGLEITPSNPADMATYAAQERQKWGPLIKSIGLKAG